MRAASLKDGKIYVNADVAEPKPEAGQGLVEVCACGICGSDLHFAKHGASMMALGKEMQGMGPMAAAGTPRPASRGHRKGGRRSAIPAAACAVRNPADRSDTSGEESGSPTKTR